MPHNLAPADQPDHNTANVPPMSTPIELVATDLDGTLWGRDLILHPAHREALDELASRDIPVVAATGRRPRSALEGFARNDILLPAVLLDGTLGEDFPAETRFHQAFFDVPTAVRIITMFLDKAIQPCVYIDHADADLLLGPEPFTDPSHLEAVVEFAHHTELGAAVPDYDVLAFTVIGAERASLAPLAAEINMSGLAEATLVRDSLYGGTSLSVIPLKVTKWNGVLAFCEASDISPDRVLAVGDAGNDVGMLRQAGHAVAPRTASADVLALADTIIDGPDDGGWVQILDLV